MYQREKRWEKKTIDPLEFEQLQKEFKNINKEINEHLLELIYHKNLRDINAVKDFLNTQEKALYDPFLMKGMDSAVSRVLKALEQGENILIYGDYDVDGTTSVAMLYSFLQYFHEAIAYNKKNNLSLSYYIPDRFLEGYGISEKGILYAEENKIDLIITVDCGIKDIEIIESLKNKNIDVIVCDHHEPGIIVPDCCAVLNPKQKGCAYPFKELSGCGVAFKLIQALLKEKNLKDEIANNYLEYVAISTVADVVSLLDENRTLVTKGLALINNPKKRSFFIQGLFDNKILTEGVSVNAMDIGFKIGPLINAAGRMEHAHLAVAYFLAQDSEEQKKSIEILKNLNEDRKKSDINNTNEARKRIEEDAFFKYTKSIVLHNEDWHVGTIGIVASRLIDFYYKPTIIMTKTQEGIYSGSGRSIPGLNLVAILEKNKEYLLSYGGHYFAAGLKIKEENIAQFKKDFEFQVGEHLSKELQIPVIYYDTELAYTEISPELVNTIDRFEPFGQDNTAPIFMHRGISKMDFISKILNNKHVKLSFEHYSKFPYKLEAIGYNLAKKFNQFKLSKEDSIDIIYHITKSTYKEDTKVQLHLLDIRKSE